ncbi:MAG TPA: hypothetical protein VIL24_02090 [Clostridia bacterium]
MDDKDFIVFDENDYINKLYENESQDVFASENVSLAQAPADEIEAQEQNLEILEAAAHSPKDEQDQAPKQDQAEAAAELKETPKRGNIIISPQKIKGRQK